MLAQTSSAQAAGSALHIFLLLFVALAVCFAIFARRTKQRFRLLSFISILLTVVGWGLVVIGSLTAVLHSWLVGDVPAHGFMALLVGLAMAVVGLLLVAISGCIGVLFAIEANTRAASDAVLRADRPAADFTRQQKPSNT